MLKYITLFLLSCAMPALAVASTAVPSAVEQYVEDAQLVGKARMKYLAWNVYDATLYAPKGKYLPGKPIALRLHYLRALKGRDIADRSVQEMRNQGFSDEAAMSKWHEQMARVFPNVVSGTELTGIMTPSGKTIFVKDGKVIGTFNDPKFGKYFFDIWLGIKTSEPSLRKKLLGQL